MSRTTRKGTTARRPVPERTAAQVMTPNPVSIRDNATLEEAVAFLVDTGYSAAPVIDEAGRPVGVISRTDIVVYDRERLNLPASVPWYFETADLPTNVVQPPTLPVVADLMTPTIFSVGLDTPLSEAAERMVTLNVHRLFVIDDNGTLVGVLSALDLLRNLIK